MIKKSYLYAISLITFLLLLLWMTYVVPPNMDEFLPYHRLACWTHYEAYLNTFREGCNKYKSEFFYIIFHRSYDYVGVTSSLLFYPFFKIYPHIYSHYLMGIIIYIIFSILVVKLTGSRKKSILIPLIYFPLLFQMIHDTGPIRLTILSYGLLPIAIIGCLTSKTKLKTIFWAITIAIAVSISLEDKPFYIYLIPQIFIISLFFLPEKSYILRLRFSIYKIFLIILALLISLIIVLFLQNSADNNKPYFNYLLELPVNKKDIFEELKLLSIYLISPIAYASRIYNIDNVKLIISAIGFAPILLICFLQYLQLTRLKKILILLSLIIPIIIFSITRSTWSGHHFIFIHIPFIILLISYSSVNTKKLSNTLHLIAFSSLLNLLLLLNTSTFMHSDFSRNSLYSYLNNEIISKKSIINFSSWGGYYQQSLFGNSNQVVTFLEPLNSINASDLEYLVKKTGREYILNACIGCTLDELENIFPNKVIKEVIDTESNWKLYMITE